MTCMDVQASLVAYCLNAIAEDERATVEGHLPGCAGCVAELVALKRGIDLAEEAPGPSRAARDRVRAAVAEALAPTPVPRRWWERPAAFVLAAAVTLFAVGAMERMTGGPGSPPLSPPPRTSPR